MEGNYSKIISNSLFDGIAEGDFSAMLACLGAFEKTFGKNEFIIHEGDHIPWIGIVVDGGIRIHKTDYQGNEVIIAEVFGGDIFAEVFSCAEVFRSPVSIVASTESRILFFDYQKIISPCCTSCQFHQRLITNMLTIVARKTLYLTRRIDVISKKSLRDKILTYLGYESGGRSQFTISMNREELANFLCADRSALSSELSKLKKEGLIDCYKHQFTLYAQRPQ